MPYNYKEILKRDLIQFFCIIVASIPFHLFLIFNLLYSSISAVTALYLVLNLAIIYALYKYVTYILKKATLAEVLKILFIFDLVPALILVFIFSARIGYFMTDISQKKLDTYIYKEK